MDGHFVPNLTIGPPVVEAIKKRTRLPLDLHLMIEEPERWVETYARAGADLITVHAEACVHLQRVLAQIREAGAQPGVALNPSTPPSVLEYVLDDLDLVLTMSVNPGFGGQLFIPTTYPKVRRLRELLGAAPGNRGLHRRRGKDQQCRRFGRRPGPRSWSPARRSSTPPTPSQAIRALRGASEVPNSA